jgi:hypothetical protein
MATERFKEFCEEHQFANAVFIRAEEYEYDFYPWENLKRAAELARLPLGEGLLEKVRPNGERLRYCVKTNELVTIALDATLKMFRPLERIKYWNAQ